MSDCPLCDARLLELRTSVDMEMATYRVVSSDAITAPEYRHVEKALFACPKCLYCEVQTREVPLCRTSK